MAVRTHCIVCDAPLFREALFIQQNMPALSQNLPTKEEVDKDKPIEYRICQCSGCGLVQFDCEPVPYYKDSTRAGERCEILVDVRRRQYRHLIETYHLQGKKIIEVGAGKGGFLKTLQEMTQYHVKGYGIENNADFVFIAKEKEGVNVFQGDIEIPGLLLEEAPYDAFTSFAYPARLLNPNVMLRNVYHNTTEGAVGLIQVPSMEHLLRPGGFYDITKDHIAYYDESSLRFLLQKNGFEVLEFGEILQIYIYAIVRKRKPYELKEIWADVEDLAGQIKGYVTEATKDNKKIAVWCAGHFAFTVLSVSGIGHRISYIIDNSEFKKNRYSPASHIPIYGPEHFREEPVETIIILGPIYVDEIVKEIKERYTDYVQIVIMSKQGLKEVN